jgi:LysR family transcriptional regulator, benzoate and cis,cis-muconate-responsive activator of ben and cat genes
VRIGAVFKRVRDLEIAILGRLVWRAADEADPLVRSLLDLTRDVHEA